jgi:hypothetical protein
MFFEPKLLFSVSDMYMNGCYCAMASGTWLFMLRKNGYTIQKQNQAPVCTNLLLIECPASVHVLVS